jgi:ppGpp synthetase/RelA/SpoT-type nucleotidyltranferase
MNLEDYEKSGRARYEKLARAVAVILKHSVDSADAIANTPQVQSRAKAPESLRGKLELRGLVTSSSIEEEIKDLAGCRIIFYTDTDLERFRQSGVWEKNFDVDWANSKTHFPHSEDASVEDLYQGIHYVVRLNADRVKLVEYADLAGLRCEIQLQTILNHAWSETSHDVLAMLPASAQNSTI